MPGSPSHSHLLPARSTAVDVGDEAATTVALADVDVAYYLVHSMAAGGGFRELDLRLAGAFGQAAAEAGVGRIVYLGGLGAAPQSAHLASRHEVGTALAAADVPVVELRAAVGTPEFRRISPTSARERRWGESCSSPSGTRPPR